MREVRRRTQAFPVMPWQIPGPATRVSERSEPASESGEGRERRTFFEQSALPDYFGGTVERELESVDSGGTEGDEGVGFEAEEVGEEEEVAACAVAPAAIPLDVSESSRGEGEGRNWTRWCVQRL